MARLGDEAGPQGDTRERLPDEAIVIRGGTMKPEDLMAACDLYLADFPVSASAGISVYAAAGESAESLAENVPHAQFRASTAGAIRAIGFEIEQTDDPPHHDLLIPLPITPGKIEQVRAQFGPPQRNPHPRRTP